MAMRLEFRRFLAERALNAFPKLELRSGQGSLEVRKAFPSQVLEFRDKRLELFDVLGEVVDRKLFGPRPL
jgi:hypothetical protein